MHVRESPKYKPLKALVDLRNKQSKGEQEMIPEIQKNGVKELGLELMRAKKTCDATILIGEERVPIKVHKGILAANSSVFEAMFFPENEVQDKESIDFTNSTEESKTKSNTPIELSKVEMPEFNLFLEYCYTGSCKISSFDIALKVYKLTITYNVLELGQNIADIIHKLLNIDNALEAFLLTSDQSYYPMYKMIVTFIIVNAASILTKPNVLNGFTIPELVSLLEFKLKVREDIILERVLEYVEHKYSPNMSKKEKRAEMAEVLRLINLSKVGTRGIKIAKDSGLFRKEELLDAMISSELVGRYFLPSER